MVKKANSVKKSKKTAVKPVKKVTNAVKSPKKTVKKPVKVRKVADQEAGDSEVQVKPLTTKVVVEDGVVKVEPLTDPTNQ